MQLMADVEQRGAFGVDLAQRFKQGFAGLRREHRGRFVENQQTGFEQQTTNDFDPLAFPDRQIVNVAARIDRQAVTLAALLDGLAQRGAGRLIGKHQRDVVGDRERFKQREMLEHHADAQLAGVARRV